MIIRNLELYDGKQVRQTKLKDHLAYIRGEPETVAKDFNEYKETGIYTWSIVANILKDCANRPTDEFGSLTVKNDNVAIIYQRYEANNNVVYLRSFYNNSWTKWDIEVNKEYVDTGLNERALLHHTHTDNEITGGPTKLSQFENDTKFQNLDQVKALISALVDSAPETLDTLKEVAEALGNDPNFATTIMAEIGKKITPAEVDSKIAAAAYVHPTNHPADMITESDTKKFVAASQIAAWNAKADASNVYTKQEVDNRFNAIGSGFTDVLNIKVPTASWVDNTAYPTIAAGYPYQAAIAVSGMTANDRVTVQPSQAFINLDVLSTMNMSYDGGFYLFAREVPTEEQTIEYIEYRKVATA